MLSKDYYDDIVITHDVTAGVKRQADVDISKQRIYSLVDVKKGGKLVEIMRNAIRKRDFTGVDDKIYELVKPFLYNGGEGKKVPISKLIRIRNRERSKDKRIPISKTDSEDEDESESEEQLNLMWRFMNWLRRLKPNPRFRKRNVIPFRENEYRQVCWNLSKRGACGETALHICLLVATPIHNDLAKRLVKLFPKLTVDIYANDEYYGETPLHMAVVNEDPLMVKFLLNYHQCELTARCIGKFFCADDQKETRIDVLEHEWYLMKAETNYQGHVYWGEYPLSFAACLELEDCYRILYAKGADPDNEDTNGNTVLHMTVITNKMNMFNLAYELGANLNVKNRQKLTPLSLAAKLTRNEMFFHILKLHGDVYWQFCDIAFQAFPLQEIDSIDVNTGQIQNTSALSVVAFGDEIGHLELFEGLLIEILQAKWNTFIKTRFYTQLGYFAVYFFISLFAFILRPAPLVDPLMEQSFTNLKNNRIDDCTLGLITRHSNNSIGSNNTKNEKTTTKFDDNSTHFVEVDLTSLKASEELNNTTLPAIYLLNKTSPSDSNQKEALDYCYLLSFDTALNKLRRILEILTAIGAVIYLARAWNESKSLSRAIFYDTMLKVPGRVLFLLSCILIVLSVPLRLSCLPHYEDRIIALSMFLTPLHFLFFCRGFKSVGPFVVMIYKMLVSDLLCFVIIYMIFVMGFAESFFVIFRSHRGNGTNYFAGVVDSVMSMFLMSLNEFVDIYAEFEKTDHPQLAKLLFIFYMILVSILLVNMLIAMMGKTYQDIASRPNEWLRQWARIVLVVERGVHAKQRLAFQAKYSEVRNGKRVFIRTWQTNKNDKEDIEDIKQLKLSNGKIREKKMEQINGNLETSQKF